jgi:ABC-type transport system involved in cytochrome c biogenesis permease subunit
LAIFSLEFDLSNEIPTPGSFGRISHRRDPFDPGVHQQTSLASARCRMVDGRRIHSAHYPLFSLRETLSFLAWALVALYSVVLYRYRVTAVGAFTMPLISVLTFIASIIGSDASNTPESFSTTWLFPIHTTLLIFAYAAFFIVFMASVMYLLQERELKLKTFSAIFHRLPSLSTVNELATYAGTFGLTLLTLGIVTGMYWSSTRSGQLWHNDPKEIFALLTWMLYFVLTVYRSTASWHGRRAAWLGVVGFALVLSTFFGAPLLGGYHVFR